MRIRCVLAFLITGFVGLTACSSKSSFESDVRKMARLQCEINQIMKGDPSKEDVEKRLDDVQKKVKAFSEEMKEKYKDKANDQVLKARGEKIMEEEMAKCK